MKTKYTTNISNMFANTGNQRLTNVNALSNWDVGNVTDMSQMFFACRELTDVSAIEDWDITNVSDFNNMFRRSASKT